MRRLYWLLAVLILGGAMSSAQDWVASSAGDAEYNCDVVDALNFEYGDRVYLRSGGAEYTLGAFHAMTVPGCERAVEAMAVSSAEAFTVTVQSIVNLRQCASTDCVRVGATRAGDLLEVVGKDGDWLEVKHEDTTAFIAGWLTARVVDPPAGLLVDFQFSALSPADNPWAVLYGSTARTGIHWMDLTQADGSQSVIEVQALLWQSEDASDWFQRPRFFGYGEHDWQFLPALLPDSSFYVHLPRDGQVYEYPISEYEHVDGFGIGFELDARPANIRSGTPVRIMVADSGQLEAVKNWAESSLRPEVLQPASRLQAPSLQAGDGQVTVSIDVPATSDTPILAYELRYQEVGGGSQPSYAFSNTTAPFVIDNLTNGSTYRVAVAAVSLGGKGDYSSAATATLTG